MESSKTIGAFPKVLNFKLNTQGWIEGWPKLWEFQPIGSFGFIKSSPKALYQAWAQAFTHPM